MKSSYNHKNIKLHQFSNHYLKRNDESFKILKQVYDGNFPYTSDFYPLLIQNFERLYKGVCYELQQIYPDKIKYRESDYKIGHHFSAFARTINKIIHISDSKDGYYKILNHITVFEAMYTPSRYEDFYDIDIEGFRTIFRRYETQMDRLYTGLHKELSKVKYEKDDLKNLEIW